MEHKLQRTRLKTMKINIILFIQHFPPILLHEKVVKEINKTVIHSIDIFLMVNEIADRKNVIFESVKDLITL